MSIGRTLAQAREGRGLSVDDVAQATRIRRTLIERIESDDFSGCGGDFYARGHIRAIAVKVGLDPAPLLAEFDATHPGLAPPRASDVFESETAAKPDRRGPNWSAVMAAALVLVVAFGIVQAFSGGDSPRDSTAAQGRPTSGVPTTTPPATPTPTATSSAVAQAPRDKVTVQLRARGTSWVRATTATGRELFQGLVADRTMTFTAGSRVRLVIGNAGAVTLRVNGRDIGSPGRPGQVARVEFTRDDPAAG